MSVRHIHAKPGEYIAVHRHHGGYYRGGGGGGGTGGGGEGCLSILAVFFVIWIIASFWEIILGLVILSVIVWVIWCFRHPIWNGVRLISAKVRNCIYAGGKRLHSYYIRKKQARTNNAKNISTQIMERFDSIADRREHERKIVKNTERQKLFDTKGNPESNIMKIINRDIRCIIGCNHPWS